MNRLDDISIFVRIVADGGVSAAAQRLQLSKSVVSRRLRALEQRLGVALLIRTTRSQKLTDEGQRFYDHCARTIAELDEAEADLVQSNGLLTGTLRITASVYFGQYFLAPLVSEFLRQHAALSIEIDLTDQHVNLVEEGIDLAVRLGRLNDSTLRARKLLSVPHQVGASQEYLEQFGMPESPAALSGHRGLMHRSGPKPTNWMYRNSNGELTRAHIQPALVSNNDFLLLQAAKRGRGLLYMPRFVLHEALAQGDLVAVMNDVQWQSANVYAVYPSARHIPSRVRRFIDLLVDGFAETFEAIESDRLANREVGTGHHLGGDR